MSNVQNLFSQPSFPAPLPGQSFFGAGNIQIFINSGTFVTPPGVTRIRVRVWGAGGSGGVSTGGGANARLASGGGGGGHGIKVIDTTPGTSYTVTVGAGGAAANQFANGSAGGTSSFGTAVTCTGGGGGVGVRANAFPATAAGGTGGTSTGGDVNYSGGAGGLVTSSELQGGGFTRSIASGGGSSGSIFGNGYAGGAATITSAIASSDLTCASGGGGVGGAGGAATLTTGYTDWYSRGGGTFSAAEASLSSVRVGLAGSGFILPFKPGITNQSGSGLIGTSAALTSFFVVPAERFNLFNTNSNQIYSGGAVGNGSGSNFVGAYPGGAYCRFPGDILISKAGGGSAAANIMVDGCGFSGSTQVTTADSTANKIAGVFGGGGGTVDMGNFGVPGCQGSVAGGGGGTAGNYSNDPNAFSGAGGTGMVVVEW